MARMLQLQLDKIEWLHIQKSLEQNLFESQKTFNNINQTMEEMDKKTLVEYFEKRIESLQKIILKINELTKEDISQT